MTAAAFVTMSPALMLNWKYVCLNVLCSGTLWDHKLLSTLGSKGLLPYQQNSHSKFNGKMWQIELLATVSTDVFTHYSLWVILWNHDVGEYCAQWTWEVLNRKLDKISIIVIAYMCPFSKDWQCNTKWDHCNSDWNTATSGPTVTKRDQFCICFPRNLCVWQTYVHYDKHSHCSDRSYSAKVPQQLTVFFRHLPSHKCGL
jgi:hypothetical protein